jgi:hypothetical protein
MHLTLTDLDVSKAGSRWVLVKVGFVGLEANQITIRLRRSWADDLRKKLNRLLNP